MSDGTLNAVLTGLFNAFDNDQTAESFIQQSLGNLKLTKRFNQKGLPSSFEGLYQGWNSNVVKKWNKTQLVFGCDLVASHVSPRKKTLIGSPERSNWKSITGEVLEHSLWVPDERIITVVDFEVNKKTALNPRDSRCVVATILYGKTETYELGEKPKSKVDVIVAELNPRFPKTFH